MNDLEQRLRDEKIYTRALGTAAVSILPAIYNGAVNVYNTFAHAYNGAAAQTGIDRLLLQYAKPGFSEQFADVSTAAAIIAGLIGIAYMAKADLERE